MVDFELVKLYHPDSHHARSLPSTTRHRRFQSLKSAYDILSHRRPSSSSSGFRASDHEFGYEEELSKRRKAYANAYTNRASWDGGTYYGEYSRGGWTPPSSADVQSEKVILWGGVFVRPALSLPTSVLSFIITPLSIRSGSSPYFSSSSMPLLDSFNPDAID